MFAEGGAELLGVLGESGLFDAVGLGKEDGVGAT